VKIREEDFEVDEGLGLYNDDKQVREHEQFLKDNPSLLYKLLCDKEQIELVYDVKEVMLKGEYDPGPQNEKSIIDSYSSGYIEVETSAGNKTIRWDNGWFQIG
jgi:hypothetical protein